MFKQGDRVVLTDTQFIRKYWPDAEVGIKGTVQCVDRPVLAIVFDCTDFSQPEFYIDESDIILLT